MESASEARLEPGRSNAVLRQDPAGDPNVTLTDSGALEGTSHTPVKKFPSKLLRTMTLILY